MILAAVICDADDPCSVNTAYAPESSVRDFDSKHGSLIVHNILAYFTFSLSATQIYMVKK